MEFGREMKNEREANRDGSRGQLSSLLFFAKSHPLYLVSPNLTPYIFPKISLRLASETWQPHEEGVREICGLLEHQISPSSYSDKSQIWRSSSDAILSFKIGLLRL
ncbi:hypothetical protein K2173_003166 [Erythroxylum novogranatense]|uniref:Uncharacterized protein n=1 Tax=Erythroxylum novogranatense TaxID=1862640 RepID=A0AAV8TCH5_9ROSI|nr:hypothetical protein K2173_003166 [Erythroxylum novogranatense]